jgi:hypothetical protein
MILDKMQAIGPSPGVCIFNKGQVRLAVQGPHLRNMDVDLISLRHRRKSPKQIVFADNSDLYSSTW